MISTQAGQPQPPPRTPPRTARKRPVPVAVHFADRPGTLTTLEGPVRYEAGAALVTAESGERWPVARARFDASYLPIAGTAPGQAGGYRKRPLEVRAWQLTEPTTVTAGEHGDRLHGQPGDWLLQYGPSEFGIVAQAIFDMSYELLGSEPVDGRGSPEGTEHRE